jgi:diguanylate cyclase (GGDEF)-like protein
VGGIVFNAVDITGPRARAAQEATLARLGQEALSGLSVGGLAAEIVTDVVELLEVDLAFYAQISPSGEELLVQASAGRLNAPSDALVVDSHTLWGQALQAPLLIEFGGPGEAVAGSEALLAAGIVSGLTVGIAAGAEPFGVLGVYATSTREFRSDETAFARGAANVLTRAIEARRVERDREHQVLHDQLTGLPNRMLLEDRLNRALGRAARAGTGVAVLLLDLDDFKAVNDSLGHDVGDVLLKMVAGRLGGVIGPADTLARLGGDEFVIVIEPDTQTLDAATAVAERIRAELHRRFEIAPNEELFVTASIGISVSAGSGVQPGTLISEADLAMYRAKHDGGDTCVVFDESLRTRARRRFSLASALGHALERDQLHLAYQPEIDLATGRTVDVEALLRWEHPDQGPLGPDTFLEIAERTGMIIPIGEWVITQACAQAASWQRTYGAAAPRRVFVNLSARQLLHADLQTTIQAALKATGLDPSHLGFEITEHAYIDNLSAATAALAPLHDHDHALYLDDFGTGYSSLTYLRTLPIDGLKIDQSFTASLHDDENDTTAIITAIVDMAHDLGLVVTAEGVENPAQAQTLTSLRCDHAQGYHYSRAVPAEDLAHLLANNTPAG